jgi:hypothetical protein
LAFLGLAFFQHDQTILVGEILQILHLPFVIYPYTYIQIRIIFCRQLQLWIRDIICFDICQVYIILFLMSNCYPSESWYAPHQRVA